MNKEANGSVIIPTLNIEEISNPLTTKIINITKEARKIEVLNPIFSHFKIKKISEKKTELAEEYNKTLNKCYELLVSPVEGPGMVMSFAQSWSTAKGVSAITQLQEAWRDLDATIDRKNAYSMASFSLYVALVSLLLTLLGLYVSEAKPFISITF